MKAEAHVCMLWRKEQNLEGSALKTMFEPFSLGPRSYSVTEEEDLVKVWLCHDTVMETVDSQ